MTQPNCTQCQFHRGGFCRYNPPVVHMQTSYSSQWQTGPNGIGYNTYTPMGQYHMTFWPGVSASDWCRMFEPQFPESRKTPYRALELQETAHAD